MGLAGGPGQCACFLWLTSTFLPFAVTVAPSIAQSPKVKPPPQECNEMVRVGKCPFQGGGTYMIISLARPSCLRGLGLIFILLLWEWCTTFLSFLYISGGISYSTWIFHHILSFCLKRVYSLSKQTVPLWKKYAQNSVMKIKVYWI